MSERLAAAFKPDRTALVTYLCIGDPTVEESTSLARACADAGADILELGVPFSDPTADGPSIARASQRALRAGGGLTATWRAARSLRDGGCDTPIVLFGYYNPLFVHGEARAVDAAADAGIDALLVVDLPIDHGPDLRARAADRGLPIIPLLAPTSSPARVDMVGRELAARRVTALGTFLYYVSVAGVTGNADAPLAEAGRAARSLGERFGVPAVVGFGIDSAEKARAAASGGAAGIVVGTALVKRIEDARTADERRKSAVAFVQELRGALDA